MRLLILSPLFAVLLSAAPAFAVVQPMLPTELPPKILNTQIRREIAPKKKLWRLNSFESSGIELADSKQTAMIFDLPVTYNHRVRNWIAYFQGSGRQWFKRWLERSHRHIPAIQKILEEHRMPKDLVYVAMIESGFSPRAVSSASAVGPWQFIRSTGLQYGLKSDWWLDERRDFTKSTHAAARYFRYLYGIFKSWYLAAAGYNMGENRLRRLMDKYKTRDYWRLSNMDGFAQETKDYVPKLMAAILIAKAPALYGFRDLEPHQPLVYEIIKVPGGTDLINLADYLGVTQKYIKDLNPELVEGFIPNNVKEHAIRVPTGTAAEVKRFVNLARGIDLTKSE